MAESKPKGVQPKGVQPKGVQPKGVQPKGALFLPSKVVQLLPDDIRATLPSPSPAFQSLASQSLLRAPFKGVAVKADVPHVNPLVHPDASLKKAPAPLPVAIPKEPKAAQAAKVAKVTPDMVPRVHAPQREILERMDRLALQGKETALRYPEEEQRIESASPYQTDTVHYTPQSRKSFYRFIQEQYRSFHIHPQVKGPLDENACAKLSGSAMESFLYQKFIREYIRMASPYRGILVYHGLGSGKTCSAIAAAEAIYGTSNQKIIVMTPFSLRANFMSEISFCGFRHFHMNNHWVKMPLASEGGVTFLYARSVLSLSEAFLGRVLKRPEAQRVVWIPDFTLPPNHTTLSDQERSDIRQQLTEMMDQRITFISYNGITLKKLMSYACQTDESGSRLFDNAVIVVDEIHNLIRLMQGNLMQFMTPSKKGKVPYEPVTPGRWNPIACKDSSKKYNRGYLFYKLLTDARNSKIIGLSGTPIINFPEELGILANVLAGYTECVEVPLRTVDDAVMERIKGIVEKDSRIDIVDVEKQHMMSTLLISTFHEGYRRVEGSQEEIAVEYDPTAQEGIRERYPAIKEALQAAGIPIGEEVYVSYPRLPVDDEGFRKAFIQPDLTIKHKLVLQKRLAGLISYYRGSKEEYMPRVVRDVVIKCQMSDYVLSAYTVERSREMETEKIQAKKQKDKEDPFAIKTPSSYRFRSRAICNFTFPKSITRPFPSSVEEETEDVGSEEWDDAEAEFMVEIPEDDEEEQEEEEEEEEEEEDEQQGGAEPDAPMPAASSAPIAAPAAAPAARAPIKRPTRVVPAAPVAPIVPVAPAAEPVVPVAPAAEPVVPVAPAAAPRAPIKRPQKVEPVVLDDEKEAPKEEEEEEDQQDTHAQVFQLERIKRELDALNAQLVRTYQERIKRAMDTLNAQRALFLKMDNKDPSSRLSEFSPKLHEMIKRIQASKGSNLVYSQFKTVEGLGVLGIALQANGYAPITILGDKPPFSFSPETVATLQNPQFNKKRFLTFTGEGSKERRQLTLDVFNGHLEKLPASMKRLLQQAGFEKDRNLYGDICWVIGITGAGAEGISLKCCRSVHIMEPYWNNVRLDQVKGRAIRICSHKDLPFKDREVEIYTYYTVFSDEQRRTSKVAAIFMSGDKGKTSDENVYEVSMKKDKVNQELLQVMKGAAVDCLLNAADNEDVACLMIKGAADQYLFHPKLEVDTIRTSMEYKEVPVDRPAKDASKIAGPTVKKETAIEVTIKNVPYVFLRNPKGDGYQYLIYAKEDTLFQTVVGEVRSDPVSEKLRFTKPIWYASH